MTFVQNSLSCSPFFHGAATTQTLAHSLDINCHKKLHHCQRTVHRLTTLHGSANTNRDHNEHQFVCWLSFNFVSSRQLFQVYPGVSSTRNYNHIKSKAVNLKFDSEWTTFITFNLLNFSPPPLLYPPISISPGLEDSSPSKKFFHWYSRKGGRLIQHLRIGSRISILLLVDYTLWKCKLLINFSVN